MKKISITKEQKERCGIAMIASAISLTVAFFALLIKKKSFWKALVAIAAAEGAIGALLTADVDVKAPVVKLRAAVAARKAAKAAKAAKAEEAAGADAEEEELFAEDECAAAEERIREVLGGARDGETAEAPAVRREVPRDEEATEADFQ